jgi:hypothetical protein
MSTTATSLPKSKNKHWVRYVSALKAGDAPARWQVLTIYWENQEYNVAYRGMWYMVIFDALPPTLAQHLGIPEVETYGPHKTAYAPYGHVMFNLLKKLSRPQPLPFETRELTEEEQQNIFI